MRTRPTRHSGMHCQPQATFRWSVVTPLGYEEEAFADREGYPLVLRKTNPISRIFLVCSSLQVRETRKDRLARALEEGPNCVCFLRDSSRPSLPKLGDEDVAVQIGFVWYDQREHAR
jgi:hypothetical protein